MKRTMLAVGAVAVVLAAGACGGGSSSEGTPHQHAGTPTSSASHSSSQSAAGPKATITHTWQEFFDPKTPLQQSISDLQHGAKFRSVLKQQANTSRARSASAKVTHVKLLGPKKAQVTYSIVVGGKPLLQGQQGTAIKKAGSWKISDASFCSLLALEGSHPKPCRSVRPSGGGS
jgi:hypothetical protein